MKKGAIIGTGFWANYQLNAWKELDGVAFTSAFNRTLSRAEEFGKKHQIANIYDDVEKMLDLEKPDFVDIITDVDTHVQFTVMAAKKGIDVICQKPMAGSVSDAKIMYDTCRQYGVKLFIHENFRWQAPLRALKQVMDAGIIGKPFKARVSFCSAFPVFINQPFLALLDNFILTDIGSHVLDICRFLFGEAKTIYCLTKTVNPAIRGEDVAGVYMEMENQLQCFSDMSYASILENEIFPQTLVLVEGEKGSIELKAGYELCVTTKDGTTRKIIEPLNYPWADPKYALVHSSIVDCNKNILEGLTGGKAETTGEDNLKTVQLVWSAYESAARKKVIHLDASP